MDFQIRRAVEDDFPSLIRLFEEFSEFEKTPEKMLNSVERMLNEKEYFNGLVAVNHEKEIVGFTTYFYSYHSWIGKCLYMDDLYVSEQYRNHGIGKNLLERVIELAQDSGCHKVKWQVSNWNIAAQKFYKSMGAQIDDIEINCDLILD